MTARAEISSERTPFTSLAQALNTLRPEDEQMAQQTKLLVELNRCLDVALNNMGRGLSMYDSNARLIVCNELYRRMYDLPVELTRPGTPLAALVRHHVLREKGLDNPEERKRQGRWIEHHVAEMALGKSFTHTQFLKDGRIVLVSNQPLEGGGWVDIQEDVTEKRRAEEKIDWLARHDVLTEVANRHQFCEALDSWTRSLTDGYHFALHWIDLDRFKEVNDTYGHPAGDALLQGVAGRLRKVLRGTDLVARLGGDEFAILQASAGEEEAIKLAQRLEKALSQPYSIHGEDARAGASIGIALAPRDGVDRESLMKSADLALYSAKARGRGHYAFVPTKGRSG